MNVIGNPASSKLKRFPRIARRLRHRLQRLDKSALGKGKYIAKSNVPTAFLLFYPPLLEFDG